MGASRNEFKKGEFMVGYFKRSKASLLFSLVAANLIFAQFSPSTFKYGTCEDVSKANFKVQTLVSKALYPDLEQPVRFSVAKDGRVFFGQRNGSIGLVQTDGSIKNLGQVPVIDYGLPTKKGGSNEFGLDGLVLDRNFETTGLIYVYYQPPTGSVGKLSRFKVNGTNLDLASEQNLITLPMQWDYCCHTGGGLTFDNKGDLWFSIGNNTRNPGTDDGNGYVDTTEESRDDQGHASNTNDFRGKILRIHPIASAGADGKLYTIPAGNLKEKYASMWAGAEADKVKPEIYTMGHRSNYTIAVDTVKNLLSWGDIGPDDGWDTEEYNLTAAPGYFGWPYFAGSEGNEHYKYRLNKDPSAPMNISKWNTGVKNLPPAVGATIGYHQSAAITGPIYRWNAYQTSPKKLPAHFDGKWFIGDFNQGYVQVISLDDAGTKVMDRKGFIDGLTRPLQVSIGPDGILYTLEYANNYFATDGATAIKRWEYTGKDCAATASIAHHSPALQYSAPALLNLATNSFRFITPPLGAKSLSLYNLKGKQVWSAKINSSASQNSPVNSNSISIPQSIGKGLYKMKFEFTP